jgi:hypothetical protein
MKIWHASKHRFSCILIFYFAIDNMGLNLNQVKFIREAIKLKKKK